MKNMSNPKNCPEAGRYMSVDTLRAMGLPFSFNGGEVIRIKATLADELHDADEIQVVYFTFPEDGNTLYRSVQRPGPLTSRSRRTFDAWPEDPKRLSRCMMRTTWANFACAKSHRTDG